MHEGLSIVTAPATEPVTLSDAKLHLRVDHSAEDDLVRSMITAAREQVESDTGSALITQTWKLVLDAFPDADNILLPRPPLQSVTSVAYLDGDGNQQTLSAGAYVVDTDSRPGRLSLAVGESWPDTYGQAGDVEITYVAGYGAVAAVPSGLKTAVKMYLQLLYERGDMGPGNANANVERTYKSLTRRHNLRRYE